MGKIKGPMWWADYIESSIHYRGGKLSYADCSQYTYTRYSAHAFPIAGSTPSTTRDREREIDGRHRQHTFLFFTDA